MKAGTCKCIKGGRKLCKSASGKVRFVKGSCRSTKARKTRKRRK